MVRTRHGKSLVIGHKHNVEAAGKAPLPHLARRQTHGLVGVTKLTHGSIAMTSSKVQMLDGLTELEMTMMMTCRMYRGLADPSRKHSREHHHHLEEVDGTGKS